MKNKIPMLTSTLLAVVLMFAMPLSLKAAEYYVSTTGSASNPGTLGQPWSLAKANSTLTAGDKVYLMAGTYSDDGYINPTNSGTPGRPITYEGYDGTVTIAGQSYGIYLSGDDYITVKGITFTGNSRFFVISNGDYNIIDNCTLTNSSYSSWQGAYLYNNSTYNTISNSTLGPYGRCLSGEDEGCVLEIGTEASNTDTTAYNLIDNCTMYHGGHHVLSINSKYNTVRNSHFYNDAWCPYNGTTYGNRSIFINGATDSAFGIRNLFEGNRMGYSDPPVDASSGGVSVLAVAGNRNLVRYNDIFRASAPGIGFGCGASYPVAPSFNYVYNNNMFDNGQSDRGEECGVFMNDWGHSGTMQGNVFKNNIMYSNGNPVCAFEYHSVSAANQTFARNMAESADPKYMDTSGTTPGSKTNPNFTLLSTSPAIDAGGALTTVAVADTGSGTSLVVTDASYFQDGTWARSGSIDPDWIAIGMVSNAVEISSINYSTNTITLSNPISRKDGDPVWLYKKSDGVRVLYGAAPDAGAHEFGHSETPNTLLPPSNLRVVSP